MADGKLQNRVDDIWSILLFNYSRRPAPAYKLGSSKKTKMSPLYREANVSSVFPYVTCFQEQGDRRVTRWYVLAGRARDAGGTSDLLVEVV